MDKPDFDFFSKEIKHFCTVHRVTLGPTLLSAYWADLKAMPRPDFERACAKLRQAAQWMPKPSEFFTAGKPQWM